MTEAYTNVKNIVRYYGKVENGEVIEYGSQIPFNFELILETKMSSTASDFKSHIELFVNNLPKGKGIQANWVVCKPLLDLGSSQISFNFLIINFVFFEF